MQTTYREHLKAHKDLAAMIHVAALPGTPLNRLAPGAIVEQALAEAELYRAAGVETVIIENMHDLPYSRTAGAEVTGLMALIGREVKALGLRCGIQILAGCNEEAVGVAHVAGLDFVRVEGFAFAHVGDEGIFESCAADLLRYRRAIGAEHVSVLADIKKKHSSHAITADLDIVETAHAAEFLLADGVVVTGSSTGRPADLEELRALADLDLPVAVGSGVTLENLADYAAVADLLIVGSWLKVDGRWQNGPDRERVEQMVGRFARRSA